MADPLTQLNRRALLRHALTVAIGAIPAASLLAACGRDGEMMERMPEWMMSDSAMMDGAMMEEMRVIRALLLGHEEIERSVRDAANGIRARTTSADPQLADHLRTHVAQMKARVEQGRPIRQMDPVFREIFRYHEAVELDVELVPGGVLVLETSRDPQVQLLIRQHAHRAVSEFVAEGMPRAMRPTPLPPDYRR